MELPFLNTYAEKDKFEERIKSIKEEKELKGHDILNILLKKLKSTRLLIKTERHASNSPDSIPYDLTIGDKADLCIAGIEIKGDTDNFSRLKHQLDSYIFAFNEVYIALHKKEAPQWLPQEVGILRVFDNGDVYIEKSCWGWDFLNISTDYEWETLFRANGLGISSKRTREVLDIIRRIRRNVLFNRFFAISGPWGSKKFKKFYPFTDEEKKVIIGFDVPYHFKNFKREITDLERRINMIKQLVEIGLKSKITHKNGRRNETHKRS